MKNRYRNDKTSFADKNYTRVPEERFFAEIERVERVDMPTQQNYIGNIAAWQTGSKGNLPVRKRY